ncbi:NYN domain-containing protein [Frankia sp. Mgl5]|uniref:NYN domain-containing protein n=1 Tax=Frankia sp. Mgl5 TaxID=2933793 RepID=UPI00200F61B7|nr:NYN domain-containing protein [Frankia sp. Mgl5]MCK9931606.1 NYN domain-containing protein [Frankia sp. Mgl5]
MVDGAGSAQLAVLIDAENIPLWAVELLLAASAQYGEVRVRRAYADWSGSLRSWKKTLQDLSIRPVQVFAAVKGKNAADLALTIDAMDLLHSGSVDGICLATSDSDFTRLAERIREGGLAVYGFGEEKTNPGLPAACDTFVFVETLAAAETLPTPAAKPGQVLVPAQASPPTPHPPEATGETTTVMPRPDTDAPQVTAAAPPKNKAKTALVAHATRATTAELRADTALISRLREAVTTNTGPDGWAHLSTVGLAIRKHPAVVLKTYGYSRLTDLMVATDLFELQRNGPGTAGPVHARLK